MCSTIAISNQKGGVGKSSVSANLGVGLAKYGKRVLVIDADPQNSLTISMGIVQPDKLPVTLNSVMLSIVNNTTLEPTSGILHHSEGIDILPANIALANMEMTLVPIMGRETILKSYIELVKPLYDFILIDTNPSLGLLTINALAAADSVLIPVTPKFLDAKGLELLLKTISQVRRQINSGLEIEGILLTMVDKRLSFTQEIIALIRKAYGGNIRIFSEYIPRSVRAAEAAAKGVSIFAHDPKGKAAAAYAALTREVLGRAA